MYELEVLKEIMELETEKEALEKLYRRGFGPGTAVPLIEQWRLLKRSK